MQVIALLLACAEEPAERRLPEDLIAPGPYGVGYEVEEIAGADGRTLRLCRWYPTPASTDDEEAEYTYNIPAPGVEEGAPRLEGELPTLVFSHGHQAWAESSSFLFKHLASHGWEVAAPDHTGNTLADGPARDTDIYWQRPRDISAVIDHLGAERVIVGGHSFGGYTAFAVGGARFAGVCPDDSEFCEGMESEDEAIFADGLGDPRAVGVVSMAAGDYRLLEGGLSPHPPILHLTAELDGDDGDAYQAELTGEDYQRVELLGGGHASFTDLPDALEDVPLEDEEGWEVIRTLVLAFGLAELNSDAEAAALLDGSAYAPSAAAFLD